MMMPIRKSLFGHTKDGKEVDLYELTGESISLSISTYGGAIVSCLVPDRNGNMTDVVLGYDKLCYYEQQDKYIGSIVGRCANRIENACFSLNGKEYTLYANNGRNHLHGGKIGFDKKIWKANTKDNKLTLSYHSPDGEEGYPGNLSVTVTYAIVGSNTLVIDYKATCDQDTICNLTNHSYFNLNGYNSGDISDQYIKLLCDTYTEANEESLPTGTILPVENTPMDLRTLSRIGDHIDSNFPQLKQAGGYDNNWCVSQYDGTRKPCAYALSKTSGIALTVYTTMPGIQFYTGNFLDGALPGKHNIPLKKRTGFCLETQYFPNALMHNNFKQPILKRGDIYHENTSYQFLVES